MALAEIGLVNKRMTTMNRMLHTLLVAALLAGSASSAQAVVVSWTDWQSGQDSTASGQINHEGQAIGVTFQGNYSSVITGGSSGYWNEGIPPAYTSGIVENAPPGDDLIQLDQAGTRTITFSQAVEDPYLAFLSWNGQTTLFDSEIELISSGAGIFGSGDITLINGGTGFETNGEFHGVIRLDGTYTSITFTDLNNEFWHGLTVGIGGASNGPPAETPEPAALGLLGLGLAGAAWLRRRKAA